MDEQSLLNGPEPAPQTGTAAEAFARLAARVEAMDARFDGRLAVMTRAVEHLATEKAEIDVPDYSNTLAKLTKGLVAIEAKPALQMTPEDLAARIKAAAALARREDQAAIVELKRELAETRRDLRATIGTAATIDQQKCACRWWCGGGFIAGCLFIAILPGFAAHLAPTGWHWPERLAARTVREPTLWEAGTRIMRADSPRAWQSIADAAELRRDNHEAIDICEQQAAKAKQPVRCMIRIRYRQP